LARHGQRRLRRQPALDILWQNDNGQAGIWFMNGLSVVAAGVAGSFNPGPEWHIIA
jgi:hypothetical protein